MADVICQLDKEALKMILSLSMESATTCVFEDHNLLAMNCLAHVICYNKAAVRDIFKTSRQALNSICILSYQLEDSIEKSLAWQLVCSLVDRELPQLVDCLIQIFVCSSHGRPDNLERLVVIAERLNTVFSVPCDLMFPGVPCDLMFHSVPCELMFPSVPCDLVFPSVSCELMFPRVPCELMFPNVPCQLMFLVTLSTQLLATIYYSIIVVVTEHVEGLTMDVKAFTGKGKWLRFASFTRNRTQCSALREISPHWEEQVVPLHKSSKSVCKLVHLQSTSKNSKHKSNTKEQHFETNYLPMHKAFDMNSGVEDLDEITAEVRRLQKFQLSFNSLFAYPVSAILLVCMCTVVTRIFDIAISWRYKDLIGGSIDVLYSCSLLVILTCTPEFLLAGRSELQGSVLDLKFLVRKAAASARHPRCYDRVSAAVEELGCLLDKFPQFSMRNLFTIGRGTLVQMWSFIATYVVILLQFQTTFEDDINVRKLWKLRRKRC
ncbi:7TM chemoreceptor [Trinorchestia longiramus]|nr:7TM chemoreceptor [Trinorchestia longiramus]